MADAAEPPPSYAQATGSSTNSTHPQSPTQQAHSQGVDASAPYLHESPGGGNERGVPAGWIRQYDAQQAHSYYVDTLANPPRSIWVHPYEDETYLKSLTSEERERVQEEEAAREKRIKATKSKKAEAGDEDGNTSGDEKDEKKGAALPAYSGRPSSSGAGPSTHPISSSSQPKGAGKWGRKMKDKITGTTHEQRQQERARRAEEERQAYEASVAMRAAIARAVETGQPQRVGRDKQGHDVYVEPPPQPGTNYGSYYGGYGGGYGGQRPQPWGSGGSGFGAQGHDGWAFRQGGMQQGPGGIMPNNPAYADPNARFVRPSYGFGYNRPYGPGYGRGGMGMPIAGGLLGGLLLGGLLF